MKLEVVYTDYKNKTDAFESKQRCAVGGEVTHGTERPVR